ncbi:MAG: hypothetical protein KGI06_04735 [Candidatus Micrarchaeota archaeon]|nr:hypothetical protein [Candidatus Micrarchaeota archaeon]
MIKQNENVALFDMDGTLCDYDGQLSKDLKGLMSPGESEFSGRIDKAPDYVKRRADILRSSQDWWKNLPKLQLGWDVLEIAQELDYRIMILTQGPRKNPSAWTGKKLWIDEKLGQDVDITITRDKGLVYGKILVDDFPEYAERWLTWRKNGLVIMPVNKSNEDYSHRQVIKYDGTNLEEVRHAMTERLRTGHGADQILDKAGQILRKAERSKVRT